MIALLHRSRARRCLRVRPAGSTMLTSIGAAALRVPAIASSCDGDPRRAGRRVSAAGVVAGLLASSAPGPRAAIGAAVGAVVGWRIGDEVEARAVRERARAAARATPDLLDRMAVCVLAGMSMDATLRMVGPRAPWPLDEAIDAGLRALDAGMRRAEAYERIAARAGAGEVADLMRALARAEAFGSPIAAELEARAADLRSRARAAAEAEARTAPVKLIFPLVLCFLPAFVLLTIAPIAISAVRTLGGL